MLLWWRHCAWPSLALQGDKFSLGSDKKVLLVIREEKLRSQSDIGKYHLSQVKILHKGWSANTIKQSETAKEL